LLDHVHDDRVVVADGVVMEAPQVGRGQLLHALALRTDPEALVEPPDERGERAARVWQHHVELGEAVHDAAEDERRRGDAGVVRITEKVA
jgi:hypothetical protein